MPPSCAARYSLNLNCKRSSSKSETSGAVTNATGESITIDVFYDDPDIKAKGLTIDTLVKHELQHVFDICDSCEGHEIIYQQLFEPDADFAEEVMCMEIRAIIAEGSCDAFTDPSSRRECVRKSLEIYIPRYGTIAFMHALEKCYWDSTYHTAPPVFPY
ncbi:hypothetical protein RISK_000326 [Rhodopirellula islandica]|uniref:Uncharacterized protein n=1 Tax=Rhodopirellula islandica TaxID=595434 RepID=A0A0J1EQ87_RHOIS|nr:hypothetical protein RISK_000326 [Rhodopirellula islandica]